MLLLLVMNALLSLKVYVYVISVVLLGNLNVVVVVVVVVVAIVVVVVFVVVEVVVEIVDDGVDNV